MEPSERDCYQQVESNQESNSEDGMFGHKSILALPKGSVGGRFSLRSESIKQASFSGTGEETSPKQSGKLTFGVLYPLGHILARQWGAFPVPILSPI